MCTLPSKLINRVAQGDAPAAAPAKAPEVDVEAMKKDPKFNKYFKMVSVGVPARSVYAKMSGDGLSDDDVKLFKIAMGDTDSKPVSSCWERRCGG